ncbi:MAG: DUF1559 domain-containing protein [Planctomycetes bacterium]|nr:DUF1559 domain-containing protein [Planctomycetota bacterium]
MTAIGMNAIGIALVWCVLQVTLACVAGTIVYFVARKVGWVAGRMAIVASFALVLALSVAALSPWPSWFSSGVFFERDTVAAIDGVSAEQDALQEKDRSGADSVTPEWSEQSELSGPLNMAFWRSVWSEMQRTQTTVDTANAPASSVWRWPAIAAIVFLVAAAAGLLRLFVAWLAVRRLDRQSSMIDDSRLTELAATISHDLSLQRSLTLKESSELQTAATFGWRRPVILLPVAWRDWPVEELRAVLAHELAHIRTGDFLTWFFAQLLVAMHFYHPLVHWLAGRLRLEQELAADATAARFAGGRETYLHSLATLTLRADHLRPSWATQTFLPTRSMFVRRIEMLKRTKTMTPEQLSGKVRLVVIGVLVAIGLLAGGLRAPGPIGATQLVAAEPESENAEKEKAEGYDFAYVPEKFLGMLAIRPADMAKSTQLAPLAKLFGENSRPSIPSDAAEQITLVLPMPRKTENGGIELGTGTEYTIFQTNRAIDFKKILEESYGAIKTERHQDKEYWTWGSQLGLIAFHSPDEKTLLSRPRPVLFEVMDNPKAAQPPAQAAAWQEQAAGPIFGIANVKAYCELQGNQPVGKLPGGFVMQMFAPFLDHVEQVTFTVDGQEELVLKVQAVCTGPEQVPVVEQTVRSALVLLENMVASQLQALENQSGDVLTTKELLTLANEAIKNANITSEGRDLRLTAPLGNVQAILKALLPKIQAASKATKRTQRMNNLKDIALAFHHYHAEHGHFPPAVLYDKETGTPYSWRVAILPYMEQHIHGQYQFNQPWDSEHNLKISKMVMPTYSPPTRPISNKTAYFLLTGPETVFAGKEGVKFLQIVDGTSSTILVVEAKRNIPWTKPEDITYSPDKPLPKLGGFYEGGFNAAFCDGSVHFLPDDIDPQTLRHLIEKADRNVVDWSDIQK